MKLALELVLLGAAPVTPTFLIVAQARPANVPLHTPKSGSRERAAIMNAMRVPVTKFQKGKRVTFMADILNVGGGWAFFSGATLDDKGHSMGIDGELLDFAALLHLEKGKWRVVEWAYAGDVVQIGWAKDHPGVPLNVLGLRARDLG